MTQNKSAGESRRSRRLALNFVALLTVGLAVLLTIGRGRASDDHGSWNVGEQNFTRPDDVVAAHLLQSVNGANAVLCAAVERAFNTGSWGSSVSPLADEAADPDAAETARWIGRDKIDRVALDVARRGLASADACTRRVAAHILGNINVTRLDNELDAELKSSDASVRAAAVAALGYAGEETALARLQGFLRDSDRSVRLAAIWALGRVGDPAVNDVLINLLQKDADAEARRLAAWALGQIHG